MGISIATPPHKFKYIFSFDVLRGFAVFLVLLLHGSYGFFKGGWIGVDLFFALSGYLITSLLMTEYNVSGNINIGQFYFRRAVRLFPALFVCILIANILWPFSNFFAGANQKQATVAAFFYFTNFISGNISGNMAHLWSLAVEEHFYLIWPFILTFIVFRISFRNQIAILIILILLVSIFRVYVYNNELQFTKQIITMDSFKFTLCRIDGIFVGALVALLLAHNRFKEIEFKKNTINLLLFVTILFFIVILFTISEYNIFLRNGGFVFTNLLCAFTLVLALKSDQHKLFSNKFFRWAGTHSYGIYLYHFPVFFLLENLRQSHNLFNFLGVSVLRFVITFLIAELSYRYVEQPFLKFKKLNTSPKH